MRETTKGSSSEFIGYRMPQHEQNWPPSVNDKISRFPGKSNSFQTSFLFLIAIAQWDVDEKDKTMSRAAKGKGESRGKNKKKRKMCWGVRQRIDRQLFKLRFEAIVNVCIKAGTCIKKRKLSFQHDVWQSLVWRRLLCSKSASAWSSASTSHFHKGIFFLFLTEWYSFFLLWAHLFCFFGLFVCLFFFFTKEYLPLLIFPLAKIFPYAKSFHVWILLSARC